MWMAWLVGLALAEPDVEAPKTPDTTEDEVEDAASDGEPEAVEMSPSEEVESPQSFVLPQIEVLPSALDDGTAVDTSMPEGGLRGVLESFEADKRRVWGASNYIRPSMSMVFHEDVNPAQLGVQAGRRWWLLGKAVVPAFTLGTAADFALARGTGSVDWQLSALGGPWTTYVGLYLGPGIGWSRWFLGPDTLEGAWAADAHAAVVIDLRKVVLSAGYVPRWLLTGDRAAAEGVLLGDEQLIRGGVGVSLGLMRIGADLSRRWTAIGTVDRVGLSMRLRI